MIYARNSDNKYGFISLIFRHLHLLFKQWMLPEKTEKKEGIKLDFHNIGNMKNSKSKLQKNATFASSMERALCKSIFAKECNFCQQHGKNPMQVQIVETIRKTAEKI